MSQKSLADTLEKPHKGRGSVNNPEGRFEILTREAVDDGWDTPAEPEDAGIEAAFQTITTQEIARSIIFADDAHRMLAFRKHTDPYQPII